MKIRVLRILEYTYDNVERMIEDRQHWHVQDQQRHGTMAIKSATMVPEIIESKVEA